MTENKRDLYLKPRQLVEDHPTQAGRYVIET